MTFQNGLKVRHFNESLIQKLALSLTVVVTRAEFYIKGEDNNAKKKVHSVKECIPNIESSHHRRKSNYTLPIKDNSSFKRVGKETITSHLWTLIVNKYGMRNFTCTTSLCRLPLRRMWWVLYLIDGANSIG